MHLILPIYPQGLEREFRIRHVVVGVKRFTTDGDTTLALRLSDAETDYVYKVWMCRRIYKVFILLFCFPQLDKPKSQTRHQSILYVSFLHCPNLQLKEILKLRIQWDLKWLPACGYFISLLVKLYPRQN
jgi:hypothetical protein